MKVHSLVLVLMVFGFSGFSQEIGSKQSALERNYGKPIKSESIRNFRLQHHGSASFLLEKGVCVMGIYDLGKVEQEKVITANKAEIEVPPRDGFRGGRIFPEGTKAVARPDGDYLVLVAMNANPKAISGPRSDLPMKEASAAYQKFRKGE